VATAIALLHGHWKQKLLVMTFLTSYGTMVTYWKVPCYLENEIIYSETNMPCVLLQILTGLPGYESPKQVTIPARNLRFREHDQLTMKKMLTRNKIMPGNEVTKP